MKKESLYIGWASFLNDKVILIVMHLKNVIVGKSAARARHDNYFCRVVFFNEALDKASHNTG